MTTGERQKAGQHLFGDRDHLGGEPSAEVDRSHLQGIAILAGQESMHGHEKRGGVLTGAIAQSSAGFATGERESSSARLCLCTKQTTEQEAKGHALIALWRGEPRSDREGEHSDLHPPGIVPLPKSVMYYSKTDGSCRFLFRD